MRWLDRWAKRYHEEKVMDRYGWVAKCENCGRLIPEDTVKTEHSQNHWHMTCCCGHTMHWSLIFPCPTYDPNLQYGYVPNSGYEGSAHQCCEH